MRSLRKYTVTFSNFGKYSTISVGSGFTPLPINQYSGLTLWLRADNVDGSTWTNNSNAGVKMNKDVLRDTVLNYLAGKKMGDLMQAEQKATIESFKRGIQFKANSSDVARLAT